MDNKCWNRIGRRRCISISLLKRRDLFNEQSQDNDFDMCHTAQKQAGIDGKISGMPCP